MVAASHSHAPVAQAAAERDYYLNNKGRGVSWTRKATGGEHVIDGSTSNSQMPVESTGLDDFASLL